MNTFKILYTIFIAISFLSGCSSMTPLTKAAKDGDIQTIKAAINSGADVNEASKGKYYAPPIHWAAKYGQLEAANILLGAGADINGRDYCDQTPLIYAIHANSDNSTEVARMLITRGANIEAFDCFGWRAINYAKRAQNAALVKLIIQKSEGKIFTDIDDPDFKPDDVWVISYKQAIPKINYKGNKKILLVVDDRRVYVISGDNKKTADYVGSPPDVKTAEKEPLTEVLGNCIAKGLKDAGFEIAQTTIPLGENTSSFMANLREQRNDKFIILTLNEWIVDNWYWSGHVTFTYDILLRIMDGKGKEIAKSRINGKDEITGYRGVHQMLAKVFAPEAAQKRLSELLNKPEIAAALR